MKILYICNTVYPFYIGGYERRYYEIAKRLAMRGHGVTLLTSIPRNYDFMNIRFEKVVYFENFFNDKGYRSLSKEIVFSYNLTKRLLSKLKEEFDIIEVNQTPHIHIVTSKLYSLLKNKPLLCTIHEALTPYMDIYIRRRLHQAPSLLTIPISSFLKASIISAQRLCNLIIAVSESTKQGLISEGIPSEKIVVVPNGIDMKHIRKYLDLRNERRNDLVTITFIGRLVPEKRPHYLIKLARSLVNKGIRKFRINIGGVGPLYRTLHKMVALYDLARYVNILRYVTEDEKYRLLASTDIFVLPSLREGFSIAVLEAMAFGIPVVVTSTSLLGISGFKDYVIHGENGFIATTIHEFVNYVESLLTNDELRIDMGRKAKEIAMKYDWDIIVTKLERVYLNIMQN